MEASASTETPPISRRKPGSVPERKSDYTAFDRDLVKAQQQKTEVTFWLAGGLPFAENAKGLYCLRAVPESVDKFMVKVIQSVQVEKPRSIWLAKNYIVAVEIEGKL